MSIGVLDIKVDFVLNGRTLHLDFRKVPLAAWVDLKRSAQLTPGTIVSDSAQGDPLAVGALVFLERKQRERRLRWAQFYPEYERMFEESGDDFVVTRMSVAGQEITDDDEHTVDDTGEDDEPDPTVGS